MSRKRFYVGIVSRPTVRFYELFTSAQVPTRESTGERYAACIGPFRTKAGAEFMRDHGDGNPYCESVRDAEELARVVASEKECV